MTLKGNRYHLDNIPHCPKERVHQYSLKMNHFGKLISPGINIFFLIKFCSGGITVNGIGVEFWATDHSKTVLLHLKKFWCFLLISGMLRSSKRSTWGPSLATKMFSFKQLALFSTTWFLLRVVSGRWSAWISSTKWSTWIGMWTILRSKSSWWTTTRCRLRLTFKYKIRKVGFSSNLKSLRCCKLTNILSGEWIDVSQLLVTRGEAVLVESGRRWAIETNFPQNL